MSEASRAARRFLVRAATLAVITSGLFAVYALRGRAIHDMADDPGPEAVATAAPTAFNATSFGDDGAPEPSDPFHSAKHALAPYLTREPSAKRHALFLVLIVVCLNSVLRILVRRGAVFGAHSTRTTEQSAALLAYWASTTLNTTGCYALAAWRGASKHAEGAMLSRWYADVGVYLLTTLLWEALAPPAGALLRAAFRADALRELYRVRAFFWRRRGHPGVARAPSLGGDEALELEDRAFDLRSCLPVKARPCYDRYVAAPLAQYVAAPPWDPTARCADLLRVFFVGATFGAGMPLLPPLAALTLALMLAHDKWALLRERRPPPRLGAHLARTAAQIAPVAAPAHALLALWTWGDAHYTGARPFFWSRDLFFSASPATWPLAVALAVCVASNVALRVGRRASQASTLQRARRRLRRREAAPQFDAAGKKTLDARQSARIDAAGKKTPDARQSAKIDTAGGNTRRARRCRARARARPRTRARPTTPGRRPRPRGGGRRRRRPSTATAPSSARRPGRGSTRGTGRTTTARRPRRRGAAPTTTASSGATRPGGPPSTSGSATASSTPTTSSTTRTRSSARATSSAARPSSRRRPRRPRRPCSRSSPTSAAAPRGRRGRRRRRS